MGFFTKKYCVNCGKELGYLAGHSCTTGPLCEACVMTFIHFCVKDFSNKTKTEINSELERQMAKRLGFKATQKVDDSYIEIDEPKKKILIYENGLEDFHVFNFEDIVEYEFIEDGETITKGGLGSAIVGGALLGGVGAIVGGVTGSKKNHPFVNSMKIKVTVKDFDHPIVNIKLIGTRLPKDSSVYKERLVKAQMILSLLALIQKQVEGNSVFSDSQNTISTADEIMKFKKLLDSGIITREEFEVKKRQLLNL